MCHGTSVLVGRHWELVQSSPDITVVFCLAFIECHDSSIQSIGPAHSLEEGTCFLITIGKVVSSTLQKDDEAQ